MLIGDIDHNGRDDILRYRWAIHGKGKWEVSWDGRSGWKTIKDLSFVPTLDHPNPGKNVFGLVGRFRSAASADLVSADPDRMGHVYDIGSRKFLPHSLYAY